MDDEIINSFNKLIELETEQIELHQRELMSLEIHRKNRLSFLKQESYLRG